MVIAIITPFEKITEGLQHTLPKHLITLLPKKWEKLGDVLIINFAEKLVEYQKVIGAIYAQVLHCRSVLRDVGEIHGVFRTPQMQLMYGDKNTVTTHVEHGVRYRLDPQHIMFSSGNIDERKRMAFIATAEECVVDLFAGIGYFSIPMAVYSKPKAIQAHDLNPLAYGFLCDNVLLNDVSHIIQPIFGDNRKTYSKQWADRVILGYFKETKRFLPTALECLKKAGGILHYHDVCPKNQIPDQIYSEVASEVQTFFKNNILKKWHIVKSYAPGINHVVLDIQVW
ncbi:MAG: class I SAM-dependent methyltransferase family protein [Candidatus Thermoplasmatota archaeon]|nr:class I SAM-dependent methyltransferase family protein [Candidatus Thermoplasmatota archaeon]MBU1940139.1 class I SAM-dependent methyltransferase family protein [Candidatus Thermoplasmatota archaeon]